MSEKIEGRLIEHEELRDIHRRIDSLKEEAEANHKVLTSQLHALEIAVARGGRFPAGAWVAAIALAVTIIGTGAVLFAKLETANSTAAKALSLIEQHMAGASARAEAIEHANAISAEWDRKLPAMDERLKGLEGRVVGVGPNGWHRQDHELYDRAIQQQFEALNRRVEALEKGKR